MKYKRETVYLDEETAAALKKRCEEMKEKKASYLKRILVAALKQEGYL